MDAADDVEEDAIDAEEDEAEPEVDDAADVEERSTVALDSVTDAYAHCWMYATHQPEAGREELRIHTIYKALIASYCLSWIRVCSSSTLNTRQLRYQLSCMTMA